MIRLLICGSRVCDDHMKWIACRGVEEAKHRGWSITVGDAEGIDLAVMQRCCALDVPFKCFGITAQPRFICCETHLWGSAIYHVVPGGYYRRDEHMVDHHADAVLAIWNGRSNGTKYTFDYAVQKGKQAYLWQAR